MSLEGKTAVVTGGGSGIGRACSPFLCTQAVTEDMLDAGWGRTINISSSSARGGATWMPQRRIEGWNRRFTKALAMQYASKGITVNQIPPNLIYTPMLESLPVDVDAVATSSPMKRCAKPEMSPRPASISPQKRRATSWAMPSASMAVPICSDHATPKRVNPQGDAAMAKISVNEDYAATATRVWKKISNFGGLANWMPGVKNCEVKGRGVGAVRTLVIGPVKVVENLESIDDFGLSLSDSLVEGPMPLHNFLATIKVTETSPSSCHVGWSAVFDLPEGLSEARIAPGLEGGYGGGLKGAQGARRGLRVALVGNGDSSQRDESNGH